MADNTQRLVIKIRPRIDGSQAGSTFSTTVPEDKLIPGTTGILEFKVEGDQVLPASVSYSYISSHIYPLNQVLYAFLSGVAAVEMAEN